MKPILSTSLLFLLLSLITTGAHAQTNSAGGSTISAASCNLSDVQAALNSVTSSTTLVTIPSGTCSWTGQLNWSLPSGNTNLTIQGNTTVNCTGTAGTSSYACSAADNTVIVDNSTTDYPSPWTINLTGGSSCSFRMTGLTVQGGSSGVAKDNGIIQINGPCNSVHIDHSHFNTTTYSFSGEVVGRLFGQIEGVIDHFIYDFGGSGTLSQGFIMSNNINDSVGDGDGTWANATDFGGSDFFFIENGVMNGGMLEDCDTGGKFVARYNSILNGSSSSSSIHTHGTKTPAGRGRSCRAYEAYHNYIKGPTGTPNNAAIGSAGGPSLVWGNTIAGGYNNMADIAAPRNDGEEAETANPTGWGYCGSSAINPSNGQANGSTSNWDANSDGTGYPCLDGLGRGQGTQSLNGQNFPNAQDSTTDSIAFPHEYLEPIYYFNNSISGINEMVLGDISTKLNRDVYVDSSNFNGTSGTGSGPLASRPSTCTAGGGGTYGQSPTGSYGVAYFATDANSGNGELYVCTAANTWTGVYQPYTYPHPLESGSKAATVAPPTNLNANMLQ